jgi:hypothetical protein
VISWIDANFLNQKNKDEIKEQVPLMGDLLGGQEGSNRARRRRQQYSRAFSYLRALANAIDLSEKQQAINDFVEKLGSAARKDIEELLQKRWFHRRWVPQELAFES